MRINGNHDGFSLEDGAIIIHHTDRRPHCVKITDAYELFVNDKQVKLDPEQQKLVRKFYQKTEQLVENAKEVGFEGAAIGLHGVGVAAKAVGGVFQMLLTNYTEDEFERDVEREAAKIEARANKLEARAGKIGKLADEVDELYRDMEDKIPELQGDI